LSSLEGTFLVRTIYNILFIGALLLVAYGMVQSLRGKEADIPTVSEAVRMRLF
jgi:hypothetical protein